VGGFQGVVMQLLGCCYAVVGGFQGVVKHLLRCFEQCVTMRLLGCCGWFPGCCYAVARVLWVVPRVLLSIC